MTGWPLPYKSAARGLSALVLLWAAVTWTSQTYPVSVPVILLSLVILLASDILIPPELLFEKHRAIYDEWVDREPLLFMVGHYLLLLSISTTWLGAAIFVVEFARKWL